MATAATLHAENLQVIDFNSVWPYIPMASMFALAVVFTLGYASTVSISDFDPTSDALPPITALILLCGVTLVVGLYLFLPFIQQAWLQFWLVVSDELASASKSGPGDKQLQPSSGTLDLLPFPVAFLVWLAYGSFMGAYPAFDGGPAQVVCAIWLLWLCLLQVRAVRRISAARKCTTFLLYAAMVFVPSVNGITSRTPWFLMLGKTTIMFLLFVLLSVHGETLTYRKRKRAPELYLKSVEHRLSQSTWVLLCPAVFLFAAAPLVVILIVRIYQNTRNAPHKRSRKKRKRRQQKISSSALHAIDYPSDGGTDVESGIDTSEIEIGVIYEWNGVKMVQTDEGMKPLTSKTFTFGGSVFTFDGTDFVPL